MNNGTPMENRNIKDLRTKKGRAVPIEYIEAPKAVRRADRTVTASNEIAFERATEGVIESYTVVGRDGTVLKPTMSDGFYMSEANPLNISIVLRPIILAKNATALPAMASVAAARAIESISDLKIGILWANDLCYKDKIIATVRADLSVLNENFVSHIVLGVAFNMVPEYFAPRLSDIVAAVFNNQSHDPSERLTEAFINEFFALYENYNNDRSFMSEYKSRSILLGRRVKVPRDGRRPITAKVCDIDGDARLIVETKDGERIPIYSRSGVIF